MLPTVKELFTQVRETLGQFQISIGLSASFLLHVALASFLFVELKANNPELDPPSVSVSIVMGQELQEQKINNAEETSNSNSAQNSSEHAILSDKGAIPKNNQSEEKSNFNAGTADTNGLQSLNPQKQEAQENSTSFVDIEHDKYQVQIPTSSPNAGVNASDNTDIDSVRNILQNLDCSRLRQNKSEYCIESDFLAFNYTPLSTASIKPNTWKEFEANLLRTDHELQSIREAGCLNPVSAGPVSEPDDYYLKGGSATSGQITRRREGPLCN